MDPNFTIDCMDELISHHPEEYFPCSKDEYEGSVSPSLEYDQMIEPIAHDLRFTFSNQDKDLSQLQDKNFINRCKHIHKNLVDKLRDLDYYHNNQYTSGFEVMNRAGEQCKAHIHLRFYSTKQTQSMRRTIKRYLGDTYDEDTTGNHAMMFKGTLVRDKEEFFRYPLKQNLRYDVCGGFTKEQLDMMHKIAKESYMKVVQVNQKKIDNKDKNDTLFQRVFIKLKKLPDTQKNARDIARVFIQFYLEEDKPINQQTITGYVTNAMIKLDLMKVDDILNKWGY